MTKIMILKWELLSLHSAGDHLTSFADTAWLSCTFVLTGPQNRLVDFTSEPEGLASVRHMWPSSEQLLDKSKSQAYFFNSLFHHFVPCSRVQEKRLSSMLPWDAHLLASVLMWCCQLKRFLHQSQTWQLLWYFLPVFFGPCFSCAWMHS